MYEIEVSDLKQQATEILRNVQEAHVEYIVTQHGQPMARLLPLEESWAEVAKDDTLERSQSLAREAVKIEQLLTTASDFSDPRRQALEVLRDWLLDYQPEDDAIMDEVDKFLENNRFSLRSDELVDIDV